jgi:Glutamine amidotransferase class-I
LAPILEESGWRTSYCDVSVEDLGNPVTASADLLIVLGGPIRVDNAPAFPFLSEEVQLLERRLARGRPTLGICLGSQLRLFHAPSRARTKKSVAGASCPKAPRGSPPVTSTTIRPSLVSKPWRCSSTLIRALWRSGMSAIRSNSPLLAFPSPTRGPQRPRLRTDRAHVCARSFSSSTARPQPAPDRRDRHRGTAAPGRRSSASRGRRCTGGPDGGS